MQNYFSKANVLSSTATAALLMVINIPNQTHSHKRVIMLDTGKST